MTPNQAFYDDNYLALLPEDRDAPILDLGCGQGDLARYLSAHGYRRVTAVDRDAAAIAALAGVPGVTAKVANLGPAAIERRRGGWSLIVAKQMLYPHHSQKLRGKQGEPYFASFQHGCACTFMHRPSPGDAYSAACAGSASR